MFPRKDPEGLHAGTTKGLALRRAREDLLVRNNMGLLAHKREYGGVGGTVQNFPGRLLEIFSSLSVSGSQMGLLPPFRMSIIFGYNADLPFCVLP